MLGVMTPQDALRKAEAAGLDLVEVSPNADPPVCKILDYGKYKYEEQKKKAQARKNQKVAEIKELRMRPMISDHDLEVKMNNARRFLEHGDKVKFTIRFRGRELSNKELGDALMARVQEALADAIKIESPAKMDGRQMIMVVAPAK
jgi:translation initiation factor IF-3